jgi:cytochrome oxidase Cu insertion factor (SCO1/SenC/PrrC family)
MIRRNEGQPLGCRLFLLLGILLTLSPLSTHAAGSPTLPEGLAAPDQSTSMPAFELPDANGETIRSADLQGKVVVVRFWATW